MDVRLQWLRCFVAVAEHLSFTRAAASLYVSQSALSKQVRSLETHLGAELFARDRHSVRLTPAGKALLPGSAAVIEAWAGAQADLASAQQAVRADLVVGMHVGVGRSLLPAVRLRLAASSPTTELKVRQITWQDPTGGLGAAPAAGGVDAAFVWLPLPEPGRFRWVPVAQEPRRLLLRADHPLAGRGSVAFAELLDERFLALPGHVGLLREHFLGVAERAGRPVLIGAEIDSTEEAVEALLAGLGAGLVAAGNVPAMRREGIAVLEVTGLPDVELVLAWRREDTRPTVGALVDAVRASIGAGA